MILIPHLLHHLLLTRKKVFTLVECDLEFTTKLAEKELWVKVLVLRKLESLWLKNNSPKILRQVINNSMTHLRHIKKYMDKDLALLLFKQMILPTFEYVIYVIDGALKCEPIKKLQQFRIIVSGAA